MVDLSVLMRLCAVLNVLFWCIVLMLMMMVRLLIVRLLMWCMVLIVMMLCRVVICSQIL